MKPIILGFIIWLLPAAAIVLLWWAFIRLFRYAGEKE
jgi:hypothetical protein